VFSKFYALSTGFVKTGWPLRKRPRQPAVVRQRAQLRVAGLEMRNTRIPRGLDLTNIFTPKG